MPRPTAHTATAVLATIAMVLLGPMGTAAAAEASDQAITWSVSPGAGPDGAARAWVELELDPGESATDSLVVANLSQTSVTFDLTAADGYFTDTGRFNMLPTGTASEDAGTWISLPDTVQVAAGDTAVVPFTVSAPADASPGDHPAGVAASIASEGTDADGNALSVESRVGFRVMTRIAGQLRPAVQPQMNAQYIGSWNPFLPGTLRITYAIRNTGNTRLSIRPDITASGPFGLGAQSEAGAPIEESAPSESRTGVVELAGVWPSLFVDASLRATAESANVAGLDPPPPVTMNTTVGVTAIPWPQLAVAVILALLVTWYIRGRRRRSRDVDRRLEAAREQGRLEASRQ